MESLSDFQTYSFASVLIAKALVTAEERAEEKKAENFLVIRDKALAERYVRNWQAYARHSEAYMGR